MYYLNITYFAFLLLSLFGRLFCQLGGQLRVTAPLADRCYSGLLSIENVPDTTAFYVYENLPWLRAWMFQNGMASGFTASILTTHFTIPLVSLGYPIISGHTKVS